MRHLTLIAIALLTTFASAQTSGRHFRRDERTPQTPAAAPQAPASDAAARTTTKVVPLRKLRSGRAWPSYHFSRLPQNATPATSANSLPKPTGGALSAPRVPSQTGPRTAFGALRSLSPSKPMRAVGTTTPSSGTPSLGPSDPTPAIPAAAKVPTPAKAPFSSEPEAAPSELDTGWSIPPPSISDFLVDDEPKKPDQ